MNNGDVIFLFKQKTAYELRISDWSSDVCSSDLFLKLARPLTAVTLWLGLALTAAGLWWGLVASPADYLQVRKRVVLGKRVSVRVELGGRRIIKPKLKDYYLRIRFCLHPITPTLAPIR